MTNDRSDRRLGFSGHQGLTSATEMLVARSLAAVVSSRPFTVGVCSLAEGSDQLFAEAVLASGHELLVVVPCRQYESTFDAVGLAQYRGLLSRASLLIELEYDEPSEEAFWAAGRRVVDESYSLIAVWDGAAAGGLGGTADVVGYAHDKKKDVVVVWPSGASRR